MTVLDIGNIYDRGERYGYISPPFDAGMEPRFTTIRWRGDTPFRTRLEFQVRAADSRESLERAPWLRSQRPRELVCYAGAELRGLPTGARWIQYRASLVSPDSLNTPVLRAVTIGYEAR